MRVTVQYLAQIKRALGVSSESCEVPAGCTLGGLLERLARRPDAGPRTTLVDDAGQPSRSLLFFIDDTSADAETVLTEGATVTILTPMAGGGERGLLYCF